MKNAQKTEPKADPTKVKADGVDSLTGIAKIVQIGDPQQAGSPTDDATKPARLGRSLPRYANTKSSKSKTEPPFRSQKSWA
jgi:hypothetical protein